MCEFCERKRKIKTSIDNYPMTVEIGGKEITMLIITVYYNNNCFNKNIVINNCPMCGQSL